MSVISSPLVHHERQRPTLICGDRFSSSLHNSWNSAKRLVQSQDHNNQGYNPTIMPSRQRPQILSRNMTAPTTYNLTRSSSPAAPSWTLADQEPLRMSHLIAPQPRRLFNVEGNIGWEKPSWQDMEYNYTQSAASLASTSAALGPDACSSDFSVLLRLDNNLITRDTLLFRSRSCNAAESMQSLPTEEGWWQLLKNSIPPIYSQHPNEEEETCNPTSDELLFDWKDTVDAGKHHIGDKPSKSDPNVLSQQISLEEPTRLISKTFMPARTFSDPCMGSPTTPLITTRIEDSPTPGRFFRSRRRQLRSSRTNSATEQSRLGLVAEVDKFDLNPSCRNLTPVAYELNTSTCVGPLVDLTYGQRDYESRPLFS